MQPVNHSPKNNNESSPIANQSLFSSKTLKITAISLITVGIVLSVAFTLASLVTGNMWLLPIALPGLLMIIPAVVLLIKTREKKKIITPEEGVPPEGELTPPPSSKITPPSSPERERTPPPSPETTPPSSPERERTPPPSPETTPPSSPEITRPPFQFPPAPVTTLPSLPVKLEARETRNIFHKLFPTESESTETLKIFSSPRSGLELCFAHGSIEFPAVPIQSSRTSAVFNAANEDIASGLRGTNKVLSESVTPESWKSTEPPELPLKESQATIGAWISSPFYLRRWQQLGKTGKQWSFLGQVLAPISILHESDIAGSGFQALKLAYANALQLALNKNCTVIQLPMLACGNYRPTDPVTARIWENMVMQAFCAAVLEVEDNMKSQQSPLLSSLQITVIDYTGLPFKNLMDWEGNDDS